MQYNDPELTEKNWCPEGIIFSISNNQTGQRYFMRYAGIEKIDGIEMCNLYIAVTNENGTMQIDCLSDYSGQYFKLKIRNQDGNVRYKFLYSI